MYWWVILWFILGAAACIGVVYLVYVELYPEEKEKEEAD
jgi:hypothetical protein